LHCKRKFFEVLLLLIVILKMRDNQNIFENSFIISKYLLWRVSQEKRYGQYGLALSCYSRLPDKQEVCIKIKAIIEQTKVEEMLHDLEERYKIRS
jgi:hypothetical protein